MSSGGTRCTTCGKRACSIHESGDITPQSYSRILDELNNMRMSWMGMSLDGKVAERTDLWQAVELQLSLIHESMPVEWTAPVEMPPPPPELLDTYDVAFSEAVKHCAHKRSVDTMYAKRERQCLDCHRYFTPEPSAWSALLGGW